MGSSSDAYKSGRYVSKQSQVNTGPNDSVDMKKYRDLLSYSGWTQTEEYTSIPLGNQVRFLMYVEEKGIVRYRAGGFLVLIDEEERYLVIRGYNGVNISIQIEFIEDLWHRHVVRKGRPKGSGIKKKKY